MPQERKALSEPAQFGDIVESAVLGPVADLRKRREEALEALFEKRKQALRQNYTGTIEAPYTRQRDGQTTLKKSFALRESTCDLLDRVMFHLPKHMHRNDVVDRILELGLRELAVRNRLRIDNDERRSS